MSAPTAQLPTYRAAEVVEADLIGDSDLMPGFLSFPENPPATVTEPVLTSGTPVGVFGTQGAAMIPMGQNELWQAIGDRMGGELEFITSPSGSEHVKKLQTMLAGGDLPDIVQLATIPRLPELLDRMFVDLTDYLAGDNINDYPNLAAIPTWSWEGCVYNGGIYTVPVTRGKLGALPLARRDLIEERGLSLDITSGEELRALCREMTDPQHNTWAIGQNPANWVQLVAQMLGAPNRWAEDNGTFLFALESPEYEEALAVVADMVQTDKVFHPDSFAGGDPQAWFTSGTTSLLYGSYAVWSFQLRQGADVPGFQVGSFAPPRWDGGGVASQYVSNAPFRFAGIPEASPDRVRELLRALNFWASPFGSEEYLLQFYGLPEVHHTFDGTDPELTADGTAQRVSPVTNIMSAAPVLYYPRQPEVAQAVYDLQSRLVPGGVGDPTVGLFSNLDTTDGRSLEQALGALRNDILAGRAEVADWAPALEVWRKDGGDQIRAEYEQAHADRTKGQ